MSLDDRTGASGRRLARLDAWIFHGFRVTPEGLGLYRIAYALFALLVVAPGHDRYSDFSFVAGLPDAFFLPPPGPMALFPGFPDAALIAALEWLVCGSLVMLLLGVRTRAASIATGLLLLLGYGFSYSLGKVNHNLLFLLVPIVMAFSNWGAALSWDARAGRRRPVAGWPLALLAMLLGFAMGSAGLAKVLGGWLDPETQAVYGHLVKQYFVRGRTDLLAPLLLSRGESFGWEVLDVSTILFELGFVAAAARASWTRAFAAAAVAFHFGVMLVLNISFSFNLIVYAAYIDWAGLYGRAASRPAAWPRGLRGRWPMLGRALFGSRVGVVAVAALGTAYFAALGSPLLLLDGFGGLASDLVLRDVLVMSLGMAVVVALVARMGVRGVRRAAGSLRRSGGESPSAHLSSS